MGRLNYNNQVIVDFDDRTLAHLQVAIGTKVRRGEAFLFSWRDAAEVGDGRTTIWITPTAPISFKYFGSKPPPINGNWVAKLIDSANSSAGMQVVIEPPAPAGG